MEATNDAEQIQQSADRLVRLLIGGKPEALTAARDLRALLDVVCRKLTAEHMALPADDTELSEVVHD